MSFDLEKVTESVAAVAAKHAIETDAGAFPAAAMRALAEAGLLGLVSATDVGGKGLGLREAAHVVERLARECALDRDGRVHALLRRPRCSKRTGPRTMRKAIAAGKHLATLAFSEVGSRSQFWAPLGTATADGSDVRARRQEELGDRRRTTPTATCGRASRSPAAS